MKRLKKMDKIDKKITNERSTKKSAINKKKRCSR